MNHHQKWRAAAGLSYSEPTVVEHQPFCSVWGYLVSYDQADVPNLAGGELLLRRIQQIEEKHKELIDVAYV